MYKDLGNAPGFTGSQRESLQTFYTSLILNRFKHRSLRNIKAMLTSLDITKTRAGQELIAMGRKVGKTEGRVEGKAEGFGGSLIKILEKRLGKLPKSVVSQIGRLDYLKLEALAEHVLEVENQKALKECLHRIQRL